MVIGWEFIVRVVRVAATHGIEFQPASGMVHFDENVSSGYRVGL